MPCSISKVHKTSFIILYFFSITFSFFLLTKIKKENENTHSNK
ncbi:hypothetical protein MtrunA17_Chr6g0455101 [Medicago truncatula]|uniref:Transmembrane protein n=1 Tax=Medicago truncatula TaxID=3880 RepID=A0A396HAA6_MEDTR|nr:hypothetical protein MtrunA17_Chr6g0455101 [Medicago truncatula]